MTRIRVVIALGALLLGVIVAAPVLAQTGTACGPFRVEWKRGELSPRDEKLEGFVYNDSTCAVAAIRLHAAAVDGEGHTVGESTGWVFGNIPARSRAYFALPVPSGAAASYRIDVLSFDQVSGPAAQAP